MSSRRQLIENVERAIRSVAGVEAKALVWDGERRDQLEELLDDLQRETTDEDDRVIMLRALAVYRSFVTHARRGGKVLYVNADGSPPRTLKVRLR